MKFKKTAILLLAGVMAAGAMLTGCSQNENSGSSAQSDAPVQSTEDASLQKVLKEGELILGLDPTFKPMGFTDGTDTVVGFDIDVAREACRRIGINCTARAVSWDTKVQELNAGKVDCLWNGMSINASREKEMNLSEPYMENEMVFVVKGESSAASQKDLDGKKVAVQNGSTAQEILEKSALNITRAELETNLEALQQLESGLVDAVFMDSVVAEYEINTTKKDYKILPDGLEKEQYAVGFRKQDVALRNKMQSLLSDMKKDGELAKISTRWFGKDITIVK